jgi:hippurate hydrolase
MEVRSLLVKAVERIVRGECAAAGSPRDPVFEYYDQYPLTDNDPAVDAVRVCLSGGSPHAR